MDVVGRDDDRASGQIGSAAFAYVREHVHMCKEDLEDMHLRAHVFAAAAPCG